MKISEGIASGYNPFRDGNFDTTVLGFDRYNEFVNIFTQKCKVLSGTDKQIRWANDIREKEIRIISKTLFGYLYERAMIEAGMVNSEGISRERLNEIGNKFSIKLKTFTHASQWINQ